MTKHVGLFAMIAAAALAACQTDRGITGLSDLRDGGLNARSDNSPGAVYALTNQVAGNSVAVFERAADGSLTPAGTISTGGTGTGAGLGSQGAITASDDGQWLLAVNAGSNDVSVFRIGPHGLTLTDREPSGGTTPISVTIHGRLVYVLNAGGAGGIAGFTLDAQGDLRAIAGSARPLSGASVGPAQVSFSPKGDYLVVTEKATSRIDVYAVSNSGLATGPSWFASAGGTPFGFAFGHSNELFVSEAAGSASSYALGSAGLTTLSGAVATNQGAPCWAVVTKNGKFGYTANAAGGSISGFVIAPDGSITLLDANGATAIVGGGATDMALSQDGQYLYQLIPGNIVALAVQADGHLSAVATVGGLPPGTVGLAAR